MKRILALAMVAASAACTEHRQEAAETAGAALTATSQELMKPVEKAALDGISGMVEAAAARDEARKEAKKGTFEIVTESGRRIEGKGGLEDGISLEPGT